MRLQRNEWGKPVIVKVFDYTPKMFGILIYIANYLSSTNIYEWSNCPIAVIRYFPAPSPLSRIIVCFVRLNLSAGPAAVNQTLANRN